MERCIEVCHAKERSERDMNSIEMIAQIPCASSHAGGKCPLKCPIPFEICHEKNDENQTNPMTPAPGKGEGIGCYKGQAIDRARKQENDAAQSPICSGYG